MKPQCFLILVLLSPVFAQETRVPPKFEDFPAKSFVGRPATPKLRGWLREYRTRIREGAKLPANFAGHYSIVGWGCGTSCSVFVVVDQKTGEVYDESPYDEIVSALKIDCPERDAGCFSQEPLFEPSSRLLIEDIASVFPEGKDGRFYYEWKNHRFNLIRADIKKPAE
jgi:hypothetical protein